MKKFIILFVIIAALFCGNLKADDIKGYMIPEYYANVSSEDDSAVDGQHGLWLRRIYLGYNTKISKKFSARVRLEMASKAFGEDKLYLYVKNAHVKYKMSKNLSLIAGIVSPPSFDKTEKFYGYRFIEKTSADLFKLASSRDFAIGLDGKGKGGLVYTLMYGNYSSNKGEDNKGKALYLRLGHQTKTTFVEANAHVASDNDKDIFFMNGFGGIKGSWGRFGAQYSHRSEKKDGSERVNTGIISAFTTLKFGKTSEVFARYDHFTKKGFKNITGYLPIMAKDYKARLIIAGLNFKVHKNIQLSPNVKYVFYSGDNHPKADVWINLTAKIAFKTKIGK